MPINAHPDFLQAEKVYLEAETKEQQIIALKKMISHAPGHKGAENLRAQLKRRLAKLKYSNEKEIKQKKGNKVGIKKEDMQAVIVGLTNTGKSTLLSSLTKTYPKIADYDFTTKKPNLGMIDYHKCPIQLIEIPAIESQYYDRGLVHTADTILIIITNLEQLKQIEKQINSGKTKKIIIFNNKENLNSNELRKLEATLKSKKYNFIISDLNNKQTLEELKEKLFQSFGKIRVYTKEPGKQPDKNKPIILSPNSNVKDAAEKILHGFSSKISQTKIWGPSSKFPGQITGLNHKLKDLDIVEFKTR